MAELGMTLRLHSTSPIQDLPINPLLLPYMELYHPQGTRLSRRATT